MELKEQLIFQFSTLMESIEQFNTNQIRKNNYLNEYEQIDHRIDIVKFSNHLKQGYLTIERKEFSSLITKFFLLLEETEKKFITKVQFWNLEREQLKYPNETSDKKTTEYREEIYSIKDVLTIQHFMAEVKRKIDSIRKELKDYSDKIQEEELDVFLEERRNKSYIKEKPFTRDLNIFFNRLIGWDDEPLLHILELNYNSYVPSQYLYCPTKYANHKENSLDKDYKPGTTNNNQQKSLFVENLYTLTITKLDGYINNPEILYLKRDKLALIKELLINWIDEKRIQLNEKQQPNQTDNEPQYLRKRTKEPPVLQQILLLELFGVMDKLKNIQGTARAEILAFLLNKSDTTIRPKLSNLGTKNHEDNPLTNSDNPKEVIKLLQRVGLDDLAETAKELWGGQY